MIVVTCTKCHATLLTTPRITDEELQRLMADHLSRLHPELRVSDVTALGEVLDQYA